MFEIFIETLRTHQYAKVPVHPLLKPHHLCSYPKFSPHRFIYSCWPSIQPEFLVSLYFCWGLPRSPKWLRTCLPMQCRRHKRRGFDPWVGKIPWRRKWQPTPVFLPGKSYGQGSLAGYSPWGCTDSDMTEQLTLSLFFLFPSVYWIPSLCQALFCVLSVQVVE